VSDSMSTMESKTTDFLAARPLLFGIAYRMLGSATEAEDVVQDAYVRWREAPGGEVRSARAYLATTVTRLAINQLRSARVRRESYVGPWLPEPLVSDPADAPLRSVELAESLSLAFLLLLERLSPVERAVFLLHEVFEFEYAEIGPIVEKSETNCRQILSRARKHLGSHRARFEPDRKRADKRRDAADRAQRAARVHRVCRWPAARRDRPQCG